jgi:hypothetical protein
MGKCLFMGRAMSAFNQSLALGKVAEGQIATWLRRVQHWAVLPVYEMEQHTGKGPRFYRPSDELIAPDMLVMRGKDVRWIEAKCKTRFSWWGKAGYFETGIDRRHYEDYLCLSRETPHQVWLLFLHTSDQTWEPDVTKWGAPPKCPTGLFGGTVPYLDQHISHADDRHGSGGMVYWAHSTLKLIATLDEVRASSAERTRTQALDTLRVITQR